MNKISIRESVDWMTCSILDSATTETWAVVGMCGVPITILGTGILLVTSQEALREASGCLLIGGVVAKLEAMKSDNPNRHIIRNIGSGLLVVGAGTFIASGSMWATGLTITGLSMMFFGFAGTFLKPVGEALGKAVAPLICEGLSTITAVAIRNNLEQQLNPTTITKKHWKKAIVIAKQIKKTFDLYPWKDNPKDLDGSEARSRVMWLSTQQGYLFDDFFTYLTRADAAQLLYLFHKVKINEYFDKEEFYNGSGDISRLRARAQLSGLISF